MVTIKLYVYGGGDSSVGIPNTSATITIEENRDKYEKYEIDNLKGLLKEFFDLPTSSNCISTEIEVLQNEIQENEQHRELNDAEKNNNNEINDKINKLKHIYGENETNN